jgi:pSer/pThr/pTyr-binding forkhead associated (FHA) protein
MNPGEARGGPGTARRQATVLESVEDIRAQIRGAIGQREPVAVLVGATEPAEDTQPFRPTVRPSMALLCVLDDGDDTGEIVRIRASSFVIGRAEGDLVIPHDSGISGRHAEISRRLENGERAWYLKDLQSTNGTFVRAATVILSDGQELMIGSHRFRFEVPASSAQTPGPPGPEVNATRKWEAMPVPRAAAECHPVLVDISPGCAGKRVVLADGEYWMGRNGRQCSIVVDDPMADRKHARLYRDNKNRWAMANAGSRNGLWARIQEIGLGRGGFFQCGEQRFFFKVL